MILKLEGMIYKWLCYCAIQVFMSFSVCKITWCRFWGHNGIFLKSNGTFDLTVQLSSTWHIMWNAIITMLMVSMMMSQYNFNSCLMEECLGACINQHLFLPINHYHQDDETNFEVQNHLYHNHWCHFHNQCDYHVAKIWQVCNLRLQFHLSGFLFTATHATVFD